MRSSCCVVAVVVVMAVMRVLTLEHVRDPHFNFSNSLRLSRNLIWKLRHLRTARHY